MTVVISGDSGIVVSGNTNTLSGITVSRGAGDVATNTAVGFTALNANTTGASNTGVGYQALLANTDGTQNTAVGRASLPANTSGVLNSGFGRSSLLVNTTGSYNTAVGGSSLAANTTASGNTAVGHNASNSNTTGASNTAVGKDALVSNTTASNNTAVGYQAGYSNTTAGVNVYVGYQSGYTNSLSQNNTFVGNSAGYTHNTASLSNGFNTYIGAAAGYSATTGTNNTFIGSGPSGFGSGYYVTTGAKNTIIGGYSGNQGGLDIRTASNYIVLSDGDGNPAAYRKDNGEWHLGLGGTTGNSEGGLVLNGAAPASGNGAYIAGQSNGTTAWVIGSYRAVVSGTATWFTCANSGGGGVYLNGASATSWTAVSDETRKVIIEPITDAASKVSTLRAVIGRLKSDDETVRRPYLIAQDVQAVLPEAVSEAEDKDGPLLGLSYTEVIPLLVAAIKELKAEIDLLKGN